MEDMKTFGKVKSGAQLIEGHLIAPLLWMNAASASTRLYFSGVSRKGMRACM